LEVFRAVSEKSILCPVNWKNDEDNMVDTSFKDQDNQLVLELGELKVRNLDNDTIAPFSLAVPTTNKSSAAENASISKRNSEVTTAKPNSTMHGSNNNVLTLDFADMLEAAHIGSKSPEYVNFARGSDA
jgi:hypothetical protein